MRESHLGKPDHGATNTGPRGPGCYDDSRPFRLLLLQPVDHGLGGTVIVTRQRCQSGRRSTGAGPGGIRYSVKPHGPLRPSESRSASHHGLLPGPTEVHWYSDQCHPGRTLRRLHGYSLSFNTFQFSLRCATRGLKRAPTDSNPGAGQFELRRRGQGLDIKCRFENQDDGVPDSGSG